VAEPVAVLHLGLVACFLVTGNHGVPCRVFNYKNRSTGKWRRYARASLDRRISVAGIAAPARKLHRRLHTSRNGGRVTESAPNTDGFILSLFCLAKTSVSDRPRNILRARREGVAWWPWFDVRIFVGLPCAAADDGCVDAVQIADHLGVRI